MTGTEGATADPDARWISLINASVESAVRACMEARHTLDPPSHECGKVRLPKFDWKATHKVAELCAFTLEVNNLIGASHLTTVEKGTSFNCTKLDGE